MCENASIVRTKGSLEKSINLFKQFDENLKLCSKYKDT